MRNGVVAALLVIAMLAGTGAGYFVGNASTKTVTSVSTTSLVSTRTTTFYTTSTLTTTEHEIATTWNTTTAPSLELIAIVNPAIITVGQNVSITSGAYNPLSTPVTVNVPPTYNPYLAPCDWVVFPTTYYVYEGHFTFSNLTGNTPLLLFNASVAISCFAPFNVTLTFQPHSDEATYFMNTTRSLTINLTYNYSGYWARCSRGYCLSTFVPGQYTVLFNDTWGQQEFEYFTVRP
jgi:hypothetical protein